MRSLTLLGAVSASRGTPRRLLAIGAIAATALTACGPAVSSGVPGNPADFSVNVFTVSGSPGSWVQRWNPCVAVHYRVNTALEPSGLATAKSAVAALSKASGLAFSYDGSTNYVPTRGSWSQPADLVISFARHNGQPGGSSYLSGGAQLGEGGFQSSYRTVNNRVTSYKINKGYAAIDVDGYNRSTAKVRTATLLHELGHAVGLNHAHFTSELMYPTISNSGPYTYTAGDLAGLKKVGRAAGCMS